MISKDMYKFLKAAPRYPKRVTFNEVMKNKHWDAVLFRSLLKEAMECQYIQYNGHQPITSLIHSNMPYSISELGQIELEEYKRGSGASIRSTLALIISGLSFLVSVAPHLFKLLFK